MENAAKDKASSNSVRKTGVDFIVSPLVQTAELRGKSVLCPERSCGEGALTEAIKNAGLRMQQSQLRAEA